jgi:hypothetical protein
VRSDRHPGRIVLRVRGAKVVRVNGTALAPRPARFHQRGSAEWQTASASGVDEMTVEVQGSGRIDAVAADVSWGLPAGGAKLIAARDESAAVPDQDGDVTVTRARASW